MPKYSVKKPFTVLVAVILVGGILVTAGSLSIPMFILFLLFAGRVYDPFTSCFMLMAEVFSALVSVKRMKQIDATPEQTGTNVCNNKGYDIEFKNVVFSYNEEPVLKGVSFVAKQGEVTALVGLSGSGKSTASKLAARFWDADSGTITLGGVDVKTVEPETLFKNYAIVFQNVMLFDETVMENIRLGRGDATDEEVMAAARAAQCEEFIQRLPQGYQTNIGENGSALSGGERQRISIARALLKNAPIVLLDEATASMDAEKLGVPVECLLGEDPQEAVIDALATKKRKPFYKIFIDVTEQLGLDIPGIVRVTGLTDRQVRLIITRRVKEAPLGLALQLSETLNVPLSTWTGEREYQPQELSLEAYEAARAYDRATRKEQQIVRMVLDLPLTKAVSAK